MKVKRIISELANNTQSKTSTDSWKRGRILKGLIFPALIPIIILSLVPKTPRTVGYRDHFTLSAEEYEKLPFVHLSDVIESDNIEEHYFSRNTLLTKSIHQLVALEVDADSSECAEEKLNSTLYELRIGILANGLMKEIMTESSAVKWSPAENKSFDALYYRTVGRKFEIIGSKGSVILQSTYIGSKDQSMVLEHYVSMFSAYLSGE